MGFFSKIEIILGQKWCSGTGVILGVVMAFRSFFKMVWPDFHGNFLEMVLMRVFSPLHHWMAVLDDGQVVVSSIFWS